MTAMLAFCRCGHLRDEHIAGGGCIHLNRANVKRAVPEALCTCLRFEPDPRLVDSEDFVGKVLEKVVAKEAIPLEPVEREEALQVLRIALWKTSAKYDSRSHVRFRVYAYLELYNDTIDHFRSERGRHGQHRVFDARGVSDDFDVDDGAAGVDRLGGAASRDPADDPDAWAADAGGLLTVGDGEAATVAGGEGGGDAPRDAGRDRRAGGRTDRRAGAAAARPRRGAPLRVAFVDCPGCGWRSYLGAPNGVPGWQTPDVCGGCGAMLEAAVEPRL